LEMWAATSAKRLEVSWVGMGLVRSDARTSSDFSLW
jgi:hypothetical protein